jgi:uncharacterized repeat protein (TIGR01451 family)
MRFPWWALIACLGAQVVSGQATSRGLSVKMVAEVEIRPDQAGHEAKLAPADRVVPGDEVIYTVEIRNASALAIPAPAVAIAIPAHTVYVAESASGPGASVSYSIDGGHTFDGAESLQVSEGGHERPATPKDYTHIRWTLKNTLKPKSIAFARFRAVVK